jgi:RNA polymerase sigma factor (TIGR02999 family)
MHFRLSRYFDSANGVCMSHATQILDRVCQGDPQAAEQLLPLVYEELRRLAAHKLANEASDHTLQPTALVHEAWLRLVGKEQRNWDGRAHFFAAAAEAMRRILIERARHAMAAGCPAWTMNTWRLLPPCGMTSYWR